MSYNGIGLSSVRGTATSGHVQANRSHVRASRLRHQRENNRQSSERKRFHPVSASARERGNKELQQHEQKRKLELHLLMLREDMEDAGKLTESEMDFRINRERERQSERQKEAEEIDAAMKRQKTAEAERQLEVDKSPERAPRVEATTRIEIQDLRRGIHRWQHEHQPQNSWDQRQGSREKNSHVNAVRKEHENERLRDAFGIRKEKHVEGQAFDQELQKQKKRERLSKLEEEKEMNEKTERKRLKESTTLKKKALKEQKKAATDGNNRKSRHHHRRSPSSSSDSSSSYSSRSVSSSSSESSRSSADDRRRRRRRARSYSSSSPSDDSRSPSTVYNSDKNKDATRGEESMSPSPHSKRHRGAGENRAVTVPNVTGDKSYNFKSSRSRNGRGRSRSSSCDSHSNETSASCSRSFSRSPSRDRITKPASKIATDCITSEHSFPSVTDQLRVDGLSPLKQPANMKETTESKPNMGNKGRQHRSRSSSYDSRSSRSSSSRSRTARRSTKPVARRKRSTSVDSFGRVRPVKQKSAYSESPRRSRSSTSSGS